MKTLYCKYKPAQLTLTLLVIAASVFSCKKQEIVAPPAPAPTPPKPALHSFAISVTDITSTTAHVEWESAVDFHLDSISYSLFLDGAQKRAGIRTNREFEFTSLTPDHNYTLKITALNSKADSVVSTITFKTNDTYLKYAKLISPNNIPEDMAPTRDKGYLVIADTSFNSRLKLFRVDSLGNVLWRKQFNLDGRDSKIMGSAGGYIVMGYNYLMKVDSSGSLIWQKLMPSTGVLFYSFVEAATKEIYVTAAEDLRPGEGLRQAAIYKFSSVGEILWTKRFHTTLYDQAKGIILSPDGNGLFVLGEKDDTVKTWAEYLNGRHISTDFFLYKVDWNGEIIWQKTYGDNRYDFAEKIILVNNQLLIGGFNSGIGETKEIQVLRVDLNGKLLKTVVVKPSAFMDRFHSIESTTDGGYVVVGTYGGLYASDAGIFKFDASDNKQWEKAFDFAYTSKAIKQTEDGGYVMMCGGPDLIGLKLNPSGNYQ